MNCRFCKNHLEYMFIDLGKTPLANSYLSKESDFEMEREIPLNALVCQKCFLVQVDEYEKPEDIFNNYAYFSSYSTSWLEHTKKFVTEMIEKFISTAFEGGRHAIRVNKIACV